MSALRDRATHLSLAAPPIPEWTDAAPSRSRCNGNCKQGRACDCVPAVEPQPGDERDSHSAAQWIGALVLACLALWAVGFLMLAYSRGWL